MTSVARVGLALVIVLGAAACSKRLKLSLVDDEPFVDAGGAAAAPAPKKGGLGNGGNAGGALGDPDDPSPSTPPPPAPTLANRGASPNTTGVIGCAAMCEKTLKCLNAFNDAEQSACIAKCGTPNQARFAKLMAMDCKTLITTLQNENNGGSSSSSSSSSSGGGAKPCGANECSTCVWDGSSCYSRVPPHLACDACCCRKGGPAPRWD